jgi:hypothetical protein
VSFLAGKVQGIHVILRTHLDVTIVGQQQLYSVLHRQMKMPQLVSCKVWAVPANLVTAVRVVVLLISTAALTLAFCLHMLAGGKPEE